MNRFSHGVSAVLLVGALAAATSTLAAEQWPSRPIRMIVPYAPGGGTDVLMRLLASALKDKLDQAIVIDNRPGAATNLGMSLAAKSSPDGYTLGVVTMAQATNPSLFSSVPFDVEKDFSPVSLIATVPSILALTPSVRARTVSELVALAKAKPGSLNYGSAGVGGQGHLAGALFQSMTKTEMVHVPYKSGGELVTALVGGQVSMGFGSIPATLPLIKSGRLIALGVSSARRAAVLPSLPTIAELGLPGFEVNEWFGVAVPKGTPNQIIYSLNKAMASALMDKNLRDRIEDIGAEVIGSTPEQFGAHIRLESAKWAQLIRSAGIKPE